jgi:hypothetical protein
MFSIFMQRRTVSLIYKGISAETDRMVKGEIKSAFEPQKAFKAILKSI